MTHSRNNVIIMLGSNTGDRKAYLDKASEALRRYVDITALSDDLDNPDFTGKGPDYLNRLLTGTTTHGLSSLKETLRQIETDLGRDRANPQSVAVDIDIVVYGDDVVKPSEYTSPPCRALLDGQKNQCPLPTIEKK
ncbi:MAG: 2-amino-4-hydroxy-6-hydroxymethyldihydropteridine diphosphokinase [Muribaculaceae bacterium]|nr:2-amino-4-hydroxy-6-hydroxymethyldihydropteridine diphosphokinase [Muribaculaceae bacterium]